MHRRNELLRTILDTVWEVYVVYYDTSDDNPPIPGEYDQVCTKDCHDRILGYIDGMAKDVSANVVHKSPLEFYTLVASILLILRGDPSWHQQQPDGLRDPAFNGRPCMIIMKLFFMRLGLVLDDIRGLSLAGYRGVQSAVNPGVRAQFSWIREKLVSYS